MYVFRNLRDLQDLLFALSAHGGRASKMVTCTSGSSACNFGKHITEQQYRSESYFVRGKADVWLRIQNAEIVDRLENRVCSGSNAFPSTPALS